MPQEHPDAQRQNWLGTLARSEPAELRTRLSPHRPADERLNWLRRAETGLMMVEARAGGSGERFNFGEVTVSRASVRLGEFIGQGYVKGSQTDHAANVAIADALLQDPGYRDTLMREVVEPLRAAFDARRRARLEEAAATRVEFFTMVRGE
ncbi:phosphonate C-P lyase system protein PhnG [Paludibacterium paludis]|uniref:Phosphonate C-P lyase system protein PhnG n=1 Tax=Paludibacterium paludis TaxID=1225769 RepID=A0A918NXR3_9NEIS|nr:phosphonate C-P lyase system protein PhnG [Paludibacterium paludis]GGY04080.1 phosphonate C-P lyase system protein PhnG [Paludibacterium paludis]